MKLIYIVDPMCSWCWGFSPVMDQLMADYSDGVTLELMMGGLRADDEALSDDMRDYILGHWQAVHERTGQPFNFEHALPPSFIYNSTLPSVFILAIQKKYSAAWALRSLKAVQQAFYAEGRDVTQLEELLRLSDQLQLDAEHVLEGMTSEATIDQFTQNVQQAKALGVMGFPSLYAEYNATQYRRVATGYQLYSELRDELDIALRLA